MSMRIQYRKNFLKSARGLPLAQQKKLSFLLTILQKDPSSDLLHSKPLSEKFEGRYSFRITRDWRVIFCYVNKNTIELIEVGHRREIYR